MKLYPRILFFLSVLISYSCQGAQTTNLPQYARSIDDLRLVLGPNYKLFVAAYWRYLINACEYFSEKLMDDLVSGYLDRYCPFLVPCPMIYETQSCRIKLSVMYVRLACCFEIFEPPTAPASLPPSPPTTLPTTTTDGQDKRPKQCNYGQVMPVARIFGGYETSKGEFPWTAILLRNGNFRCGCVIIDPTHVITAAHCFDLHKSSTKYMLVAGRYSQNLSIRESGEQVIPVKFFILHESYNTFKSTYDLAIVTLQRPLEITSYVTPACLPSASDLPEKYCTVAGWGVTSNKVPSEVLMKVRLQVYNHTSCLDTFRATASPRGVLYDLLSDRVICAANGTSGGQDACQGDSGGPLMCIKQTSYGPRYFVFGIVSNGKGCATPGEPGLYTYLPRYLDWIDEKTALT